MVEVLTLLFQVLILAALVGINWGIWRTTKMTRQISDLIEEYRREIRWLTMRLDTLEARDKRPSVK